MAKITATEVILSQVENGVEGAFYPLRNWLRDTCIPSVRPLYSILDDHWDDELKAAALLKHTMEKGPDVYELVIVYECYVKTFQASAPRRPPTMDAFMQMLHDRALGEF